MTDKHDRNQHQKVDCIQRVADLTQHPVVKFQHYQNQDNVNEGEQPLSLHKPITVIAWSVDMGRAAYYQNAHA